MFFGAFIDAAGNWLDTVHFVQSAKKYPLQGRGYYRMTGKVTEEFGVYAVDVSYMQKVGIKTLLSVGCVNKGEITRAAPSPIKKIFRAIFS